MKKMRTWFAADKTGFHMLHALFQTSLKYPAVRRYDEWFVTRLLVDDGRVHGVVAVELTTGRIQAITARAVVLATGGCGKVFPFTTNANINTGDGMALAYRAGAPLKDMEFVQYHPTGLPFTGILITEAARAEGGWLLNKDGYRYLQDYDLGTPTPTPELRSMELGPRDRLSQAFVAEVEKGRTTDSPYGPIVHLDLRHLGEALDRGQDPVRPRAVPEVRADRPGDRADPGPARRALHDGRRPHRHRRGHPARPACTPPARPRASASTAPTGWAPTPCPECLVFGARAGPRRRRVRRHGGPARRRRSRPRSTTRCAGSARPARHHAAGRRRRPRHPRRDAGDDGGGRRHLPQRSGPGRRARPAPRAAGADRARSASWTPARRSTPSWSPRSSWPTCSTSPSRMLESGLRREESRGAHQRTDFPARDDERFLTHQLVHREPGRQRPDRAAAGDHHPVAAGRTRLREVTHGRQAATTEQHPHGGLRYRPDKNTPPLLQQYDVPLRTEWTVLDGLNHVKNHLDPSLAFRWSCRMGICGSCGMNVNGEPRLTCGTFLSDYAPGPVRVEPLGQLPGRARPGRRHVRLHGEAAPGQALDHPRRRRDGDRRGVPPDARGARRLQAVQHVHQLHALLRRLPGLRARPGLHRAGGDRARRALRPRLARPRRPRAARRPRSSTTGSGAARSSASAPAVCPKHVDPAGAIQRYKLKAAQESVKAFLLPRGAR